MQNKPINPEKVIIRKQALQAWLLGIGMYDGLLIFFIIFMIEIRNMHWILTDSDSQYQILSGIAVWNMISILFAGFNILYFRIAGNSKLPGLFKSLVYSFGGGILPLLIFSLVYFPNVYKHSDLIGNLLPCAIFFYLPTVISNSLAMYIIRKKSLKHITAANDNAEEY